MMVAALGALSATGPVANSIAYRDTCTRSETERSRRPHEFDKTKVLSDHYKWQ